MKNNIFQRLEFLSSAYTMAQVPPDTGREVAFAGRSNTGKSSVINIITGRKGLARTSKTPGRTRLINFFAMDEGVRLVDLPGYGYARVSVKQKQHWGETLRGYFAQRRSLKGLILIIDIRRELTRFDRQMLDWCRTLALPVHILLNKADKLSNDAARQSYMRVKQQINDGCFSCQLFSVLKKTGVEEVRIQLLHWLFDKG